MLSLRALPALFPSALVAVAVSSCVAVPPELPAPLLPVQTEPAPPRPGPIVSVFPGPALVIEKVEGAEAARARAVFAPMSAAVRECRPGSGGVIRLTLTANGGKAAYAVEPATSLDPRHRRCVLEALSTVDIEGISGDASPSARPPGFTAQFRLEW